MGIGKAWKRRSVGRMAGALTASLMLAWLPSCNRDFDNPLDPENPLSGEDSALVAGLGLTLQDFLLEFAPDCRLRTRACLDTAFAHFRLGLGRHPRIVAASADKQRLRMLDTVRLSADAIGLYPVRGYAWAMGPDTAFSDTTPSGEHRIAFPDSGAWTVRVKALAEENGIFASPESALTLTVIRDIPVAMITGDSTAKVGDTLKLAGRGVQEFGHIVRYKWSDGRPGEEWKDSSADSGAGFAYASRGSYEVRLQVRDDIGNTASAKRKVLITNDDPVFQAGLRDTSVSAWDTLRVRVKADDPEGIVRYLWDWEGNGNFTDTTVEGENRHVFPPATKTYDVTVVAFDPFDGWMASWAKVQVIADIPEKPEFHLSTTGSPTNVRRPYWAWMSGGGTGDYRYKLDDSDLTQGAVPIHAAPGNPICSFLPVADLPEGKHVLCVQERNAVGTWSPSSCKSIVLDLTPPAAPLLAQPPTPSNNPSPEWTWTGAGGMGIFRYRLDSLTWSADIPATKLQVRLTDGKHELEVQERDSAGNWSASGRAAVAIRTVGPNPPVFTLRAPSPTNIARPLWTWRSGGNEGGGVFRIRFHKYSQTPNLAGKDTTSDTLFAPETDLPEGDYVLEVSERDAVGNWSAAGFSYVTIDRTPPAPPTVETNPASPTNVARPSWIWAPGGGGIGNFRIRLDDSDLTSENSVTVARDFTPGSDLADGVHTLYVQEKDSAGNWSSSGTAKIQVEKNRLNPPTVSVSPASPTTNTRPTWTWAGNTGGSGTYRYSLDDSGMAGSVTTTQSSFTPSWDLAEGTHTLFVQVRDGSGLWSFTGSRDVVVIYLGNTATSHVGWAVGDFDVFKTSTGGAVWNRQNHDSVPSEDINSVFFSNANTGWIIGSNGSIRKTIDGGVTWGRQTSGTSQTLYSVHFVDANSGWVVGGNGTVLKTSNGGASWIPQNSGTSIPLKSVHFIDPNTGWIVGNGIILKTSNAGATWSQQSSGISISLNSVHFVDASTGWAVGGSGTILKTSNGGASWVLQNSTTLSVLFSVFFVNSDVGWAVGGDPSNGTILKTINGGAAWEPQNSGTSNRLYSIRFVDESIGWAVGEAGVILKTSNGGGSWVRQSNGTSPLQSVYFINYESPTQPSRPQVSVSADTNSPTPSWRWISGGGTGIYRYKLDNADLSFGANHTSYTRFVPPSFLSEGPHTLYIQEMGDGGTWSDVGSATVRVDLTPPNPPAFAGPSSPTNNTRPTWTWAGGGGGSGVYRFKLNDSILTQGATVISASSYTPVTDLEGRAHFLYVQEQDAAGNWSAVAKFAILVDLTPPYPPIVAVPAASTNMSRPAWSWMGGGGGGGGFRYKLDDSDLTSGSTMTSLIRFTPETDLAEGLHTLFVQERDSSGNWSRNGRASLLVDKTPPSPPLVTVLTTSLMDPKPNWRWRSSGGGNGHFRFKLDDASLESGATLADSLEYTPSSNLNGWTHTLYVQERDSAGNWSLNGSMAVRKWNPVGNIGFSEGGGGTVSLKLDPSGIPYVAYFDNGNGGRATVMRFNGIGWEYVGLPGFSSGQADFTSLTFSASGMPYVAFRDHANNYRATVMRFNGVFWENVGQPGFSAGASDYISLAMDDAGIPYVAYTDRGSDSRATVMRYNGTIWESVGQTGFTAGEAFKPSLVVSSSGVPYLAYSDGANGYRETVVRFRGGSWEYVGAPGFSMGVSFSSSSLALDRGGVPYLAYSDGEFGARATVVRFNGNEWEYVGAPGFSSDQAEDNSLALDSSGTPYVAYMASGESYRASVMKYNGSIWEYVGSPGFSLAQADYTSLELDANGIPYVAYMDSGSDLHVTVMKCGP